MPNNVYKSILVGVDFSPCSASALRVAADLARRSGAFLRVVHYIHAEIVEQHRREWHEGLSQIVSVAYKDLGDFVERALETTENLQMRIDAHLGHSFVEMFKAIDEYDADLLVLGAHGRHHPEQQAPGILPTRCVRKAPCEVMLVDNDAKVPFQQILVAVDYSANSALALTEADQIAKLTGAKIQAVHISPPPWLFLVQGGIQGVTIPDKAKEEYRHKQEEDMTQFLKGLEVDETVEYRVIENPDVVPGLIECQKEMNADLIVLGTRGQTQEHLDLLGSFAERVIRATPCSVLAVKPEGRNQQAAELAKGAA